MDGNITPEVNPKVLKNLGVHFWCTITFFYYNFTFVLFIT